ncbi:unnamed protein product [Ceratitis capitata]|uniref:(Mediterranean fruit fly) hypothetical protein n=1 Tax=Ceratitis capitata TaxID=7213 RepID=A0A811UCQ5_CERCA|nr:unnamed protein product [Ceratitis capitata]
MKSQITLGPRRTPDVEACQFTSECHYHMVIGCVHDPNLFDYEDEMRQFFEDIEELIGEHHPNDEIITDEIIPISFVEPYKCVKQYFPNELFENLCSVEDKVWGFKPD